jgi:hypothetical protein
MKADFEAVPLEELVGYLAKLIVCQCHHSASTLMPAAARAFSISLCVVVRERAKKE